MNDHNFLRDLFTMGFQTGYWILRNNPGLAHNIIQMQIQAYQNMNETNNKNLANENGSSEKNENLNSTDLMIQEKNINADGKSINEINEIKKSTGETLINASNELDSQEKIEETLNNSLKETKDQNDELKKEKSKLVSKLNKMKEEVSECDGQQNNSLKTLWDRYVVLKEKNNNLGEQLDKLQKENANLKEGNKELQKTLNELQEKIVTLESKNNKTEKGIKKTNTMSIKKCHSSQSILEKANKLKIKFNQVPGKKPALANNSINQI